MPSLKKIMESSEDIFRGRFQVARLKVATKFRSLCFIVLTGIRFATCFILGRGLLNYHAASSTTMESLPLKVLDFGLQMPTGPRQIEETGFLAFIDVIVIPILQISGMK